MDGSCSAAGEKYKKKKKEEGGTGGHHTAPDRTREGKRAPLNAQRGEEDVGGFVWGEEHFQRAPTRGGDRNSTARVKRGVRGVHRLCKDRAEAWGACISRYDELRNKETARGIGGRGRTFSRAAEAATPRRRYKGGLASYQARGGPTRREAPLEGEGAWCTSCSDGGDRTEPNSPVGREIGWYL